MKPAYALHYSPPGLPVLFRFRSPADRDAYVAEFRHYRRPVPPPDRLAGFTDDTVSLKSGRVFHVAFRTATIDDLVPVPVSPPPEQREPQQTTPDGPPPPRILNPVLPIITETLQHYRHAMKPKITVPRTVKPNTGLTQTTHRGKPRFFARYWSDGKLVTSTLKASTVEEARVARDRFFDELVAAGATRRNKTSKTPEQVIKRIREIKGKEAFLNVVVRVQGKHVGSFDTWEEAIEARDAYIHQAAVVKKSLVALKKALR